MKGHSMSDTKKLDAYIARLDLAYSAIFIPQSSSRKAENIYNDCLKIALKLRVLIGDAALTELRELFQDY